MKRVLMIVIIAVLWVSAGNARDFIVEFVEENYKEAQAQFSYTPLIYHSIQVNSNAGPKVLILTGDDAQYRNWLRYYIAKDKKFIAKVDDDRVDEFISSAAYKIDVTSLHPFDGSKWERNRVKTSEKMDIIGNNNILIVDIDEKRMQLASTVIEKMGYEVIVFSSASEALDVFELQPEKFKMVMVNHAISDMAVEDFVDHVVKSDHNKPVVIDIGYHEPEIKDRLARKFAGFGSVHLKPVLLRELSQTIDHLIKKRA